VRVHQTEQICQAEQEGLLELTAECQASLATSAAYRRVITEDGPKPAQTASQLLCGLFYLFLAMFLNRRLRVEALAAYTALYWLAPVAFLGGWAYMGAVWPEAWPQLAVFGEAVPPPAMFLLLFSIATVIFAARLQNFYFVTAGLGFTAYALWNIGSRYLGDEEAWPILVLVTGLLVTLVMVTVQLTRKRGEDIDDLAERLVRRKP